MKEVREKFETYSGKYAPIVESERTKNYRKNKDLCDKNSGFMLCPRCNGTKYEDRLRGTIFAGYENCDYCNGEGVITWIDEIIRGKRIP